MGNKPLSPLVKALIDRQAELGIGDREFAARLRITRQAWQLLRTGESQPGTRTLRAISEAFKDLKPDVWDFVAPIAASKSDK